MDDDEDFDFDAIDRLEQNALAARQVTNGAQINQQFAGPVPQQSYPAYQPPNNAPTSGYYQPPNQQTWNGGGQPVPWQHQQQQQQWPPPVAAEGGHNQPYPQQPYPTYTSAQPPGQVSYNNAGQPQHQQPYHHQQQPPPLLPPNQPAYHNQQQQWNPPPPQSYGYPPAVPHQQQKQQGNAWQPVQRPSVWQPNNPPPPIAQNNNKNNFNHQLQGQQQQQHHQHGQGNNRGGQGYVYSGAPTMEQRLPRQPQQLPQQQQQGAKAGGGPTDRAQRDLYSLWGVPKQQQQQKQQQNSNTVRQYSTGQSNMPPPPLPPSGRPQGQSNYEAPMDSTRRPPQAHSPPRPPITSSNNTAAHGANDTSRNRNTAASTIAIATTIASVPPAAAAPAGQLVECETTTGCLKVSPDAAQHWVYPLGVPEREYQLSAISTALLQNTLVCLPTGLGKTLIAAVVMHNFSRWFPQSKVVFVAPTKPLVSQQIEACRNFMGLSSEATAELTGRIKAEERKALWQDDGRRVFFCTPQTFYNDVKLGVCPYDAVSCVVVDECHRATGQSEIVQTLRLMRQKHKLKFRVLGLSATPGSNVDQVQEVLTNLGAAAVHFRNEEDPDVSLYVHKKITELVIVEPESESNNPRTLLLAVLHRIVGHLAGARFYFGPANAEHVTRLSLVQAQNTAKEAAAAGFGGVPSVAAQEWFRQAVVLTDVRDSLDKYGILPTASLVRTKLSEETCIKALHSKEPTFAQFVTKLESSAAAGGGGPRLAKLIGILREHFEGDGTPGGVIVFASLREGVQSIVDALKQHEPLIRARSFVGQGSGSGAGGAGGSGYGRSTSGGRSKSGTSGPGMNQKEQKDAIKGFSNGQYNVLVATCIGEEGLDIPAVDLILCYDATASPTRAVQRRGRTGRHREGKVIYLLGAGREEEHYHRIKESTTQLHSQLRQAERYFELVLPGPRMLPRQYNPEKLDVDAGGYSADDCNDAIATEAMKTNGRGAGARETSAQGRGGGGRGGSGSGRGRNPAQQPATGGNAGVLAMLEAGAIRLAEEGPRYPQAPLSPLPSQPGATQFDTPAGPHQLLFPENSSSFIHSTSNGRRLAIAPPPSLDGLLLTLNDQHAAAPAGAGVGTGGVGVGDDNAVAKVPTPLQPRKSRFLPEIGDDGIIILPCGKTLQQQQQQQAQQPEREREQQQPAWALLAIAIARPLKSQFDATAALDSQGAGIGGSKKRKIPANPRRGKKALAVAGVPRPTPPTAVLNLAQAAVDVQELQVEEQEIHPLAAPNSIELPTNLEKPNKSLETAAVAAGAAAVREREEPEVINLFGSEEQCDDENPEKEQEEDFYSDNSNEDDDIIESSSQPALPPPRIQNDDCTAAVPASTAATNGNKYNNNSTSVHLPEQEDDIPLAKRMRMLRGDPNGPGAVIPPPAAAAGAGRPTSVEEAGNSLQIASAEPLKPTKPTLPTNALPIPASKTAAAAEVGDAGGSFGWSGGAAVIDDFNNYDFNDTGGGDGGGNYFQEDYGFEEDELWEEWQDEEAMAAAAEVEREGEEKERQALQKQKQYKNQQQGGPKRRNIITTQSPGSSQPVAVASVHLAASDHSPLPSAGQVQLQQQRQREGGGQQQKRGLTRLRKAGADPIAGGGLDEGRNREFDEDTNEQEEGRERNRPLDFQEHHQQQRPRGCHRGGPSAAAARFLDTEAQLSGDDTDEGNEGEELDGYESDFINDGLDDGDGGGDGGTQEREGGSLATPRDHASLAAFYFRRLNEDRNSPSASSLLRRLQRARLGRRGGVAAGFGDGGCGGSITPAGLSAPYGSDDYDREDSFIDDGEGEDGDEEEEEGFDTPAGRGSHADECGACGYDDGVTELLLCDACPAAFHLKCVGLTSVPIGDWFCPICVDSNTPHGVDAAGAVGGGGGREKIEMTKKSSIVPPAAAQCAIGRGDKKNTKAKLPLPLTRPPNLAAPAPPAGAAAPAVANNKRKPLLNSDSDDDFA